MLLFGLHLISLCVSVQWMLEIFPVRTWDIYIGFLLIGFSSTKNTKFYNWISKWIKENASDGLPRTECVPNAPPAITGYREKSEADPNWMSMRLVIRATVDSGPSRVDNRTGLELIFANRHGHDAHIATHLAMCPTIICRRLLEWLESYRENMLSRGQAVNDKNQFYMY